MRAPCCALTRTGLYTQELPGCCLTLASKWPHPRVACELVNGEGAFLLRALVPRLQYQPARKLVRKAQRTQVGELLPEVLEAEQEPLVARARRIRAHVGEVNHLEGDRAPCALATANALALALATAHMAVVNHEQRGRVEVVGPLVLEACDKTVQLLAETGDDVRPQCMSVVEERCQPLVRALGLEAAGGGV